MEYMKVKQSVMENIPEDTILNRQEILRLAMRTDSEFKETLLRNLIQKLLNDIPSLSKSKQKKYQNEI